MTTTTISKTEAEALWAELEGHLLDTETAILRILATEAWKPLGYSSFFAAWNARLSHVRLASDVLKVQVLYAYFKDDAAASVKGAVATFGINEAAVMEVRGKFLAGVEPATVHVQAHDRRPATSRQPYRVTVELTEDDRAELVTLLGELEGGMAPSDWAKRLVEDELLRLRRMAANVATLHRVA